MSRNCPTPKQQRFVDEYLIDLNATQAAIRAGYSAKTAGSQAFDLLRKPEIQDYMAKRQSDIEKRTEITQDKVLTELAKIGFADIRNAVQWGNTELIPPGGDDDEPVAYHGLVLKASDEIDNETAAAISEVSQTRDGLKVKFHDKRAALVDIGRHLGMFKDRLEHTGADGGPIKSRIEIEFVNSSPKMDGE